jgi:hypothetical protein
MLLLLLLQAFDAAGRQPGSFIAQAVVDIAAMLQQGSLNASAPLVNRKGNKICTHAMPALTAYQHFIRNQAVHSQQ